MRRIMLSFLCLLMHLLQVETTSLLVLENQDLQDSIKPQKVEFHSLNFNTTLHWQPGWAREARDALYFVQYKVYGQSTWQNKDNCWGIPSRVCDLTHETSDIQEPYYGRVRATLAGVYSSWSLSCRFTPWRETMVGPPMVTVVHSNNSIIVKLQAPQSPYKRKRGSKITMTNYYDLLYQVFIINNLLDEQHRVLVYEGKDKVIKIQDLRPGVSYCIVAKTYVPMLDRSSAYSSRQCTVLQ
ncbi:interleukin-22 receptor subunit alpha-2 isoform X2 [Corvus hawaiiensis]|uniref:interleukin-22 receptor subunit alpha-2 isoform X2 n=1 Tax=Corvus hawaiiensis TaxID=134902 RepID=UPI002018517E|nr:interleukin-22 receptor subunit alpha-2 isoform X2 [Corvus hawaiiensis]